MEKLHRMVSIDLNTPTPSIVNGVYQTKSASNQLSEQNKKNHWKSFGENEPNIYEKYFHKRIAKPASFAQLSFAVVILICQLSTTGLLIGPPVAISPGNALSTSDRAGLGIWASIVTTLAVGATFWAINKTNFCRLHSAMLLHFISLITYNILEYLLLTNTIPNIQERIYYLQENMPDNPTTMDARRQLLNSRNAKNDDMNWGQGEVKMAQVQMQAELHRLYAALVLSIVMSLTGIIQLLLHFLMNMKTGRAICMGKTYFEGKLLHMQSFGRSWRNKSFRFDSKDSTFHLPKLERSDALPPPPYESGYFHPSLSA